MMEFDADSGMASKDGGAESQDYDIAAADTFYFGVHVCIRACVGVFVCGVCVRVILRVCEVHVVLVDDSLRFSHCIMIVYTYIANVHVNIMRACVRVCVCVRI